MKAFAEISAFQFLLECEAFADAFALNPFDAEDYPELRSALVDLADEENQ